MQRNLCQWQIAILNSNPVSVSPITEYSTHTKKNKQKRSRVCCSKRRHTQEIDNCISNWKPQTSSFRVMLGWVGLDYVESLLIYWLTWTQPSIQKKSKIQQKTRLSLNSRIFCNQEKFTESLSRSRVFLFFTCQIDWKKNLNE